MAIERKKSSDVKVVDPKSRADVIDQLKQQGCNADYIKSYMAGWNKVGGKIK